MGIVNCKSNYVKPCLCLAYARIVSLNVMYNLLTGVLIIMSTSQGLKGPNKTRTRYCINNCIQQNLKIIKRVLVKILM